MLGLDFQTLNPASSVSAHPLKVDCTGGFELEAPQQPLKTFLEKNGAEVPEPTHQEALTPPPHLQHPLISISQSILISADRTRSSQRNLYHKRQSPLGCLLIVFGKFELKVAPPEKVSFSHSRRLGVFQTASQAVNQSANLSSAALDALQADIRVNSPPRQLKYPGGSTPAALEEAVVTAQQSSHQTPPQRRSAGRNLLARRQFGAPNSNFLQSPFHTRAAASSRVRQPSASRLWNPTNSTPRVLPSRQISRRRRLSTPPPPPVPVPLDSPTIDENPDSTDPISIGAGNYPLLAIPEQRQNRRSASTRTSLQIEGRSSGDYRVSLPKSLRHSYDEKRISNTAQPGESESEPFQVGPKFDDKSRASSFKSVTNRTRALSFGLVRPDKNSGSPKRFDKGKAKAVMTTTDNEGPTRSYSKDLERGPDALDPRHSQSNVSLPDGLGSPVSSSDSSIMGDPDQPDTAEEWGPQHPCFPHLNPHVPIDSLEYANTRIIRIRRDWLLEGDLAPTFSNLYPEILDPAGVSEQEFRQVIEKLNGELIPIFNPYNWRNMVDGVLGVLTGWVWDDMGFTNTKSRLRSLETWIEKWNSEMEKTVGSEEGAIAPKIVPLRRTAYMSLDIQIPDPEIAPAATQPNSRSGLPTEFEPAVIAEQRDEAEHDNDGQ